MSGSSSEATSSDLFKRPATHVANAVEEDHVEGELCVVGELEVMMANVAGEPVAHVGAVRICKLNPTISVEVHADVLANVNTAFQKRVVEKLFPLSTTKEDVSRLSNATKWFATHIITERRVKEAIEEYVDIGELKSGKWSDARFRQAINKLHEDGIPRMQHSAQVKIETICKGKAPRMLVADGDTGQIMALAVIGILEKVVFKCYRDYSIKGRAKTEVMDELCRNSRRKGSVIVEGDGASWDTKCGNRVRDQTENILIKKVGKLLTRLGFAPKAWIEAHEASCTTDRTKVRANTVDSKKLHGSLFASFDAMRRTGHRGTSVLNWLVNVLMWAGALADHDVNETRGQYLWPWSHDYICALDGQKHFRHFYMEGDDSLLRLDEHVLLHQDAIEKFWHRWGFVMKLKYVQDGAAEFCGWHIHCEKGWGTTTECCPDILRAYSKIDWSTGTEIRTFVQSMLQGTDAEATKQRRHAMLAAQMLSTAMIMAGRYDVFAGICLAMYQSAKKTGGVTMTQNLEHQLGERSIEDVVAEIHEKMCAQTTPEKIMADLGIKVSEEATVLACRGELDCDHEVAQPLWYK